MAVSGRPGSQRLLIEWPPMEIEAVAGFGLRAARAYERLWTRGRLRTLVGSPEGRAALEVVDTGLREVARQAEAARSAGRRTAAIAITVPADLARLAFALLEPLLRLASDERTMASVGWEALTPADVELAEAIIEHIRTTLSRLGVPE